MAHGDIISHLKFRNRHTLRKQFLALTRFPAQSMEKEKRVHALRVLSKRLRAYLLLFCSALGKEKIRGQGKKVARAAKYLAASRNSHVFGQLVEKLKVDRQTLSLPPDRFPSSAVLEKITKILNEARDLLLQALPKTKTHELRKALKRSRKNVLKKSRKAGGCHTGSSLHRWRKSIKHHLYQLELVASENEPDLEKEKSRLRGMEGPLGKIHDLDELETLLTDSPAGKKSKKLLKKIRGRQKKQARKVFQKI